MELHQRKYEVIICSPSVNLYGAQFTGAGEITKRTSHQCILYSTPPNSRPFKAFPSRAHSQNPLAHNTCMFASRAQRHMYRVPSEIRMTAFGGKSFELPVFIWSMSLKQVSLTYRTADHFPFFLDRYCRPSCPH